MYVINDQLAPSKLEWPKPPENVLVVKKLGQCLYEQFLDILTYLLYSHRLNVYIEKAVFNSEIVRSHPRIRAALDDSCLRSFDSTIQTSSIDFVVCLGGDGTFLHAASLFQAACPPILSIYAGSLGFLCPFDFENYKSYLNGVIKGNVPILYRNRLKFKLEKSLVVEETENDNDYEEFTLLEKYPESNEKKTKEEEIEPIECLSINEITISRGPTSSLSNLDLYANDYLITSVQGDGLIMATPTGSTAYAMAAGASLCHPGVAATLIVPICPHSLSFRPIVVPASAGIELKIKINSAARSAEAFCSIDGRVNVRLTHASQVIVTASQYPVPFVCRSDQVNEWFEALATCLNWNHRARQLPLNSGFISRSRSPSRSPSHSSFSSSVSSLSSSKSFSCRNLMPPQTNDYLFNSNSEQYKSINFSLAENDDNNNRVKKDDN